MEFPIRVGCGRAREIKGGMMKQDFVSSEFDRLRGEIATWPNPDRPKAKEPEFIDLRAPLTASEKLRAQNAQRNMGDE